MFRAEMKKIWRPGIIALGIILSLLLYFSLMYRWVKPFTQYRDSTGTDSLGMTLELCNKFMEKYGNDIDADEFAGIKREYTQLLSLAGEKITENELFVRNGINNYEDYLQYMQKAVNGDERYDYGIYSKMRDLIIQETGKSPIYFETYETIMQQYETAGRNRTSVLPAEVVLYANNYFVYLIIWCLICTFLIAAPVMVNDRANHVIASQYASKIGKKIYGTQYLCMVISTMMIVSMIVCVALFIWRTTGTLQYENSKIMSFLNTETSVVTLTYGQLLRYFVLITYLLTLGITNIVFYLSANSTNVIHMLIKTIPVLIAGCLIGLFMQGALCQSNSIYSMCHIPYCELIIAFIVFAVGLVLNFRNYRRLRREDPSSLVRVEVPAFITIKKTPDRP